MPRHTPKERAKRRKPPKQNSPANAGEATRVYDHRSNMEPVETRHGEAFHKANAPVDKAATRR